MKSILITILLAFACLTGATATKAQSVGVQSGRGATVATQDRAKTAETTTQLETRAISNPGVWRFRGLAGKCLDAGPFPLGQSSSVVLYNCNGAKGQNITQAPVGESGEYELRAHGRCLTVAGGEYEAGTRIVLEPCDRSLRQRFYVTVKESPIAPSAN